MPSADKSLQSVLEKHYSVRDALTVTDRVIDRVPSEAILAAGIPNRPRAKQKSSKIQAQITGRPQTGF
jgi:hypothetical protein